MNSCFVLERSSLNPGTEPVVDKALINTLSPDDFRNHFRQKAEPAVNFLRPHRDFWLPPEDLYPLNTADRVRYPLPGDLSTVQSHGMGALSRRIEDRAITNVQKRMSEYDKDELARDGKKFSEDMKRYDDEPRVNTFFAGDRPWPSKPPEKPASIKAYEQAIDREVDRISQRLMSLV